MLLRFPILIACVPLLASGCSSDPKPSDETPADAGPTDASVDSPVEAPPAEASDLDSPVAEAATVVCPEGSWGTVPNTQCDMIAQDCESPLLTCYPNMQGGYPGTSCTYIGYGAKRRGSVCDRNAECASGLVCLAGNCTTFCCPEYQYEICGPGGQCEISFSIGGSHSVLICGYSEPCTLWADDCPEGEACQPVTDDGSAACTPPSSGSFVGEGNQCSSRNDCGDSQRCVSEQGDNVCRYYCKRGDSPWDAGAPNAAPGEGGCPDGQICVYLADAPTWLGVCRPDV